MAKKNCYVYHNDGSLAFTRAGVNEALDSSHNSDLSFTVEEVKNKPTLILDKLNKLEQDYTFLFVPKKKFRPYSNLADLIKTEEVFW